MAYSNVGTPVFYIDNYLYHNTIGTSFTKGTPTDVYNLKPAVAVDVGTQYEDGSFDFKIHLPLSPINYNLNGNMKYYIALLNHNLFSGSGGMNATAIIHDSSGSHITMDFSAPYMYPNMADGTTILTTSVAHDTLYYKWTLFNYFRLGAVSTGIQYTMPKSPDLDVSMEIEFDGIKTIKTSGGGSLSNVKYSGNPLWINGDFQTNPFDVHWGVELDNLNNVKTSGARRNGRKTWSLKFTYMSDEDLFSSNPGATKWTSFFNSDELNSDDVTGTNNDMLYYNIETDDSFYAQVWNKTLGGALPFIFQPNSNDGDDLYICKFDQKSLKVSQSAYKVYDVSLKIQEVW